jgi:hypothetical protein
MQARTHTAISHRKNHALAALVIATGAIIASCAPIHARADEPARAERTETRSKGFSAHFNMTTNVSDQSVMLPVYPGAVRVQKAGEDESAVDLSFGFGNFGFKLNVVTMKSEDSPEKIAAFYRRSLAAYGEVLDCGLAKSDPERKRIEKETRLDCKSAKAADGQFLYRVGKKNSERVVSIKPHAKGSEFNLISVSLEGGGKSTNVSISAD